MDSLIGKLKFHNEDCALTSIARIRESPLDYFQKLSIVDRIISYAIYHPKRDEKMTKAMELFQEYANQIRAEGSEQGQPITAHTSSSETG